jgi:valyl-tRNA synthetase
MDGKTVTEPKAEDLAPVDRWILSRMNRIVREVTDNMEKYEVGVAAAKIYDFIWSELCDWYIEMVKPRLYNTDDTASQNAALYTLKKVLVTSLKLLHPYMPFVTEEIYCTIKEETNDGEMDESIMISDWPVYDESKVFEAEEKDIELIKEAIRGIRNVRTEMNVAPSKKASLFIVSDNEKVREAFSVGETFVKGLASATDVNVQSDMQGIASDAVSVVIPGANIYIPFAELVDISKEKERLTKEVDRLNAEIKRAEGMLNNERFTSKAPAEKVQEERDKLDKYRQMLTEVTKQLEKISNI